MTDHNREEREALIKHAAYERYPDIEADPPGTSTEDARFPTGWSREQERNAFIAGAVFEQAHAPTRGEREAAMDEAWGFRSETRSVQEKWSAQHWFDAGWDAAVLRCTAVQEPSAEDVCAWCPAPARGTAIWQGHDQREPSCGEDGHGMRFERADHEPEVQGEPTDAQLLAALNAHYRVRLAQSEAMPGDPEVQGDAHSLEEFSSNSTDRMRAALRAAYEEGKKR